VKALQGWEGGANAILATAPSAKSMSQAFAGLAPDGVMIVVGASIEPIQVTPNDLLSRRRRIEGNASGSRHDLRDVLEFASKMNVQPEVQTTRLEDVNDVLDQMHDGKLPGRVVIRY
jgi:D-arabinose 1-dehydrogenase-like Zn-dependent alcohol dehydrogenase